MNNRIIEFRAWHILNKEMLHEGWNERNKVTSTFETKADLFKRGESVILMQFTGLLDKDGIKIFEGDYDDNYDVVAWCDKRNGWALKTVHLPELSFVSCHCYKCDGDFEIDEDIKDFKVCGNIFYLTNAKTQI